MAHAVTSQRPIALVLLLCGFALLGCSSPHQQVPSDARAFVLKHLGPSVHTAIEDYGPGEGDSTDSYYHVKLQLTSPTSRAIESGPFAGLTLVQNVPTPVELEMLYQFSEERWSLTLTIVHLKERMP